MILNWIISILVILVSAKDQVHPFYSEDVLEVHQDNFEQVTRKHEFISIVFFATWCPYCKRQRPAINSAAYTLRSKGIRVGAINGPLNRGLMRKFGGKQLPDSSYFLPWKECAFVYAKGTQ